MSSRRTKMTGRERMMAACKGGPVDRVPVAPDISNYIPCRYTGKPFWDIYIGRSPSLWEAYIEAVKRLGIDAWFVYGDLRFELESKISAVERSRVWKTEQYWDVEKVIHTPDGELREISRVYENNPPTRVRKMVQNLQDDFKKLRHLYARPERCDPSVFLEQKRMLGELGLMAVDISVPGFPTYLNYFDGNLEALTYAYYDHPDIFQELASLHHRQSVAKMELIADLGGVDSILIGFSGGITLQSPEIFDMISFPTTRDVASLCAQAGIIAGLHSCGKEYHIVKRCAEETELDYINPLEVPPMGDCSLADLAAEFGNRITLMGNLHTTEIMLNGTTADVRRESLKAMRDAGAGGRFILSTGDRCGYGTPEENLREMVRVADTYGTYPLDLERIDEEIGRLAKS